MEEGGTGLGALRVALFSRNSQSHQLRVPAARHAVADACKESLTLEAHNFLQVKRSSASEWGAVNNFPSPKDAYARTRIIIVIQGVDTNNKGHGAR